MDVDQNIVENTTAKKNKKLKKIKTEVDGGGDSVVLFEFEMLLLANTYFLNPQWTKALVIGYSPENFDVMLMLLDSTTGSKINLNVFDWCGVFVSMQKITKFVQQANLELTEAMLGLRSNANGIGTKHTLKTSPSVSFVVEQRDGDVKVLLNVYKGKKIAFTFSIYEWFEFYNLGEFINNTINHQKVSSAMILSYFEQYVERCKTNQQSCLDLSEFFIPQNAATWNIANYSRLFLEFPLFCKNKIVEKINTS